MPQKPNVLFIANDDLRPEFGCYDICDLSRTCILTGLRPDTLKIEEFDSFFRSVVHFVREADARAAVKVAKAILQINKTPWNDFRCS